jgi:hypothetical protein
MWMTNGKRFHVNLA